MLAPRAMLTVLSWVVGVRIVGSLDTLWGSEKKNKKKRTERNCALVEWLIVVRTTEHNG